MLPLLLSHACRRWTSSCKHSTRPAFRMKRCCRRSFAVGRRSGFFTKHAATKSFRSRLYWLPCNRGAGAFGMRNRTFIGCVLAFGGSAFAISIVVIPRDQMSALKSYPDCSITSGAIQNGVPTNVFRCDFMLVSCAATPKSANLTLPDSARRTLAALTSL